MNLDPQFESNLESLRWTDYEEEDDDEDEDEVYEDNVSTDSDSGISLSSLSCDSNAFYDDYTNQDFSFISTVDNIIKDLLHQSTSYVTALMDFTLTGLISADHYIRSSAAVFLWQLFRACNNTSFTSTEINEKMWLLIKSSEQDIFQTFQRALELDEYSNQMLYWISGCLHYISRNQYGCEKIWRNNMQLVLLLFRYNHLPAVVFYTITTVHNILLTNKIPFKITNDNNSNNNNNNFTKFIELLLEKLFYTNPSQYTRDTQCKLLAICIDCLTIISYHNEFAKSLIILPTSNQNAILKLLTELRIHFENDKLLLLGLRFLKILSTNQTAKSILVSNKDFLTILRQLFPTKCRTNKTPSTSIWLTALWIMRNLSDVLFRQNDSTQSSKSVVGCNNDILEMLCCHLCKISQCDNDLLLQCAAGVLANASCDCRENKELLVKMKVHEIILVSLSAPNYERWSGETLEALYRCLHHLCSNNVLSKHVVKACLATKLEYLLNIRFMPVVDLVNANIVNLSYSSSSNFEIPIYWSVIRAWLGLVRHLYVHKYDQYHQHPDVEDLCLDIGEKKEDFFMDFHNFTLQIQSVLQYFQQCFSKLSKQISANHQSDLINTNSSTLSSISSIVIPDQQQHHQHHQQQHHNHHYINYLSQLHSSIDFVGRLLQFPSNDDNSVL